MPKIRGVKPDYWTDEAIVDLTIPARLLFVGLWNYACDNGHLQDKSKQIKMRVLPADDVNVAELLRELEDHGRIDRNNGWITVPNFTKHQKPDKRYFQTCDAPGCERPHADSPPGTRGGHHETTAGARSGLAVGSQGPHVDGDGDGEVKVKGSRASAQSDKSDESFEEFWTRYPRKIAKGSARKAWTTAAKKADVDTIVNATRSFAVRSAGADPKFIPHAATWLNGERWADEIETQKAEAAGEWFQPFTPGEAPPEVADDPERYAAWLEGRRDAWRQAGGR